MSKILSIAFIVLSLFLFVTCKNQNAASAGQIESKSGPVYTKISAQEAKQMMDEMPSITVVDVRTRQEFEAGHIEGSLNIPNEIIGTSKVESLPDLDATILVYCRSGARSSQAARKLIALGYTNIIDFGGIINWPYEVVQ